MTVQRFAAVIRLRPEKEVEYRALHAKVWPEVLAALRAAGVSNYSIFLRDGLLFSYLEYSGQNYAADTAALAQDEATKLWWTFTDPCQQAVDSAEPGQWWAPAEEVFRLD